MQTGFCGPPAPGSGKERNSRFLVLAKLENKTATALKAVLLPRLCRILRSLRRPLMLDSGSEMARFKAVERATGLLTDLPL